MVLPSELTGDIGRNHDAPPFRRTERDAAVSAANTLIELLGEVQHIRHNLGNASDSRSSATVKSSTRGVDLETKSYADGLLPSALDEALREYARGMRELQRLQANQWQETLTAMEAAS